MTTSVHKFFCEEPGCDVVTDEPWLIAIGFRDADGLYNDHIVYCERHYKEHITDEMEGD